MSETYQVSPGVRMSISSDEVGLPPNSAELQKVFLWDIGPEMPKPPTKPVAPKGKEGEPDYDLARVEFKIALEEYEAALKEHRQRKKEFNDFKDRYSGPIELEFWSCDAFDALERDHAACKAGKQSRQRYYLSSRTRGHAKLANRGLPEGMKAGRGQADAERRAREGDELFEAARRADPVFGQPELRQ